MPQPASPAGVPSFTLYTGQHVPAIGMGTFGSDHAAPQAVSAAVAGALRCGYRLFDCASVYGNEDQIGLVLEAAMRDGTVTRDELFITSKVWNDMHGRGDVLLSCAKSLRDLRLDYVDAYFLHWPFPNYHAPGCDGDARNPASRPFSVEAFMAAWRQMERLVDMGLARCIGMSNMTVPKLEAVLPLCRIRPALIEMELHPSFQQPALFNTCMAQNIRPVGFCPLGSPNRPERDRTAGDVVDMEMPELVAIAEAHGVSPAAVCLRWAVQQGAIPIPFSTNPARYEANLRGVAELELTDAEMKTLSGLDADCRLVKGQVFLWEGAAGWEDLWDTGGRITS